MSFTRDNFGSNGDRENRRRREKDSKPRTYRYSIQLIIFIEMTLHNKWIEIINVNEVLAHTV